MSAFDEKYGWLKFVRDGLLTYLCVLVVMYLQLFFLLLRLVRSRSRQRGIIVILVGFPDGILIRQYEERNMSVWGSFN